MYMGVRPSPTWLVNKSPNKSTKVQPSCHAQQDKEKKQETKGDNPIIGPYSQSPPWIIYFD